MKKIISLLLALVLCLGLCACSSSSNEIELTPDNASKYLNIYVSIVKDHSKEVEHDSEIGWLGNCWDVQCVTKGASSNFNYNDIYIKAKITITYTRYKDAGYIYNHFDEYDTQTVTRYVEITPDIAGNGLVNLAPLDLGDYYATNENGKMQKTVEIIEISGTVSPA